MIDNIKDWDEYFFRLMYLVSSKSPDPRTKIGAVLVRDKSIIATGYNGFAKGVKDCNERYKDREQKINFICHAEFNSIVISARFGISTKDCKIYTNGIPCNNCSKALIQGGVSEIIVHKQWPEFTNKNWVESVKISKIMLQESGIPIRIYDKFLDIKTLCDGNIITV